MAPKSDGGALVERWGCKAHNFKSIVEVSVQGINMLPFEPPAAEYLKEALMGLRASPHDKKSRELEPKLAQQVDHLFSVAQHEAESVQNACTELFWIAMGRIFTRAVPDVIEGFRSRLAHSWHSLCVISGRGMLRADARDWALTALLMVIVQAIYRLLIDGFSADRPQFADNSVQILDKLMQLVHFETSGFHIQPETARKERRKLFSKYVLNSPAVPLEELEKIQKRQEFLESMKMSENDQPLTFGQMHTPMLDNKQLKSLLDLREQDRQTNAMSRGFSQNAVSSKPLRAQSAPTKRGDQFRQANKSPTGNELLSPIQLTGPLGVDRYDGLLERGAEIFRRQMQELAQKVGDAGVSSVVTSEPAPEEENDHRRSSMPTLTPESRRRKSQSKYCSAPPLGTQDEELDVDQPVYGNSEPVGPTSTSLDIEPPPMASKPKAVQANNVRKRGKREPKTRNLSKAVTKGSITSQQSSEAQKKARKNMVDEIINAPLQQDPRERTMKTTWVSPAVTRLCGDEGDRNVLRKSTSETFNLKMETPVRPASAPLKVKQHTQPQKMEQPPRLSTQPQKIEQQASRLSMRPTIIKKEDTSNTGLGSTGGSWFGGKACEGTLTPDGGTGTRSTLSSAHRRGTTYKGGRLGSHCEPERGELITLETKPISMKTIMQRLETMSEVYQKNSFSEYMKEYDMFTGDKITPLDEKATSEAEIAYVRSMEAMVGGKALTVNPFTKDQMRRMEHVANYGKPASKNEAQRPRSAGSPTDKDALSFSMAALNNRP